MSYEFGLHLKQCGIVSQLTPPGTPQCNGVSERRNCWRYALEAIMYDDISYVFMNKDSPWTLSMMCISKYVTCLWDYALYDDCPKRSLVERAVWTRSRLD